MSVAPETFKSVMGLFPTGVTVVTTKDSQGEAYGVTVSSFASLSLKPPLVLVCLDRSLSGLEHFRAGEPFSINLLAADQAEVSNHFAVPGTNRTRACGLYTPDSSPAPWLRGTLARIDCVLESTYPGGDHEILVGRVTACSRDRAEGIGPLLYFRGQYAGLGGISPFDVPVTDGVRG